MIMITIREATTPAAVIIITISFTQIIIIDTMIPTTIIITIIIMVVQLILRTETS
jgi:hypothetical protein